jgi:signal transduction histidine kinase
MPTNGIDTTRLSMVIHDLRNALNAMAMTQYCIESGLPAGDELLRTDVAMIGEGILQLRNMLEVLSAYGQNVLDNGKLASHRKFDPTRLVKDVIEEVGATAKGRRLTLTRRADAPAEVVGSEERAHLALRYALHNALASGGAVEVEVGGAPGMWRTRVITPEPPAETVHAGPIDPEDVHRLVGNARERRGMDLAIVATLCGRDGGSCRIEVEPERSSALVLDWPTRPASGAAGPAFGT